MMGGTRRRRGRLPLVAFLGLILLAAGCDSPPSGPGALIGSVQGAGNTLGGAVLEVSGEGITSFSGAGSTQVFWASTSLPDTYRLVLIAPAPGALQFQVSVEDRGGRKPAATLVSLIAGDNTPLSVIDGYRVTFTRD